MIPIDSLPIDGTDDGSGKHCCHHCMPAPLAKSLEGFSWSHKDGDHRHIVKDGKIRIPANCMLHSWIHGDHIHIIWPDSPDRPFDGKIYFGSLPEPEPDPSGLGPESVYYQDTKGGKEWGEWAHNAFLNQESQRKNAALRCAVCGEIIESDGAACWKCGVDLLYHGCFTNKKTGKKVPLNSDGTRHGVNSCPRYFMDPVLDNISYDNELSYFLHNGHPTVQSNSKDEDKTIEPEDPLAAAVIAKFKREREAADEANRLEIIKLAQTEPRDQEFFDFQCYIPACKFGTNNKKTYERHIVTTHPSGTLCYPGKVDLRIRGWKAQGRTWEI